MILNLMKRVQVCKVKATGSWLSYQTCPRCCCASFLIAIRWSHVSYLVNHILDTKAFLKPLRAAHKQIITHFYQCYDSPRCYALKTPFSTNLCSTRSFSPFWNVPGFLSKSHDLLKPQVIIFEKIQSRPSTWGSLNCLNCSRNDLGQAPAVYKSPSRVTFKISGAL